MRISTRLRHALSLGGLSVRELVVRTYRGVNDNEIQTRAAGIAFYAMLALVPFIGLIIFMAIQLLPDLTGSARAIQLGHKTVSQFEATLNEILPKEASQEIQVQIGRLQEQPPVGFLSFGLAITLWLASSMFVAIIDATNRIYGVRDRRSWIQLRLIAIAMTVIQASVLIGSLLIVVASSSLLERFRLGSSASTLLTLVQFGAVFLMVLLSFGLTFYVAPDADQKWEWITPGTLVGAGLFLVATIGFRVYVQNFAHYDKTYGILGGVMVLLFWFWISALVLLGAAQVNTIIEEASPLGRKYGQRAEVGAAPDFTAMKPEPEPSAAPDFVAMKPEAIAPD